MALTIVYTCKKQHFEDTERLVTEIEMLKVVLYLMRSRGEVKSWLARIKNYAYFFFQFRKKRKSGGKDIIYLFIYGCCPGGAFPAGFVAGFCVNPPPWHTGCCPPG
jgi:hypothetical protein